MEKQQRPPTMKGAATNTNTNSNSSVTDGYDHGAMLAADALAWWNSMAWEQAVERAAATLEPFAADDLQARYDLPDIGNGCGGLFMRAHKQGLIRKVGYRPSSKTSRSGSVVAVWCGVTR